MHKSWFMLGAVLCLMTQGCSKNCQDLCEEAQADGCTSISGDCGKFCDAADNINDDAGCDSSRDAYEECLNEESNVCDANCDTQESAYGNCIFDFCSNKPSNNDCEDLLAALL
jgi:hypothetical protein